MSMNQPKKRTLIFTGLSIVTGIIGTYHAHKVWFINDDAFISFRYAKNFVNGLGLVYNAGERVEGYTNFFWTMIISIGMKAGIDPVPFSVWCGIAFYALTLTLFAYLSWKFTPNLNRTLIVLPLTAICLSIHRDFNVYATSGLETSMYTFMVSAAVASLMIGKASRGSLILSGFLITLATMTRPDGALFGFALAAYVLLTQRSPLIKLGYLLLPVMTLFLPYWLWRWSYFGFFFPNTFYAKSVDLPYYQQGMAYLGSYFTTYYIFLIAIPLGLALLWRAGKSRMSIIERARSDGEFVQPLVLVSICIFVQSLFIVRVGGDFMFARFFIPITPLMFFALELIINKLFVHFANFVVHLLLIAGTTLRYDLFSERTMYGYIADEPQWYTRAHLEKAKREGEMLRTYLADLPVAVAFWGEGARLVYYADIPVAIEAAAGLTDATIAHQILSQRMRPGHEKKPTLDYLIARKVNFLFAPPETPSLTAVTSKISFGNLTARILTYDPTIMAKLKRYPDVKFVQASGEVEE